MSTSSVQSSATQAPASGSFNRVRSVWDLVLFGIAFVSPTAPYALFGIVADKSNGHVPLVYLVAMVAMSFTAVSYGRMATAYPEPGSTYTFASKALHPNVGFFAGWGMILDYILIPLLSIIYVGLTGPRLLPQVPHVVWVIGTAVAITAISLRGIEMTARANLVFEHHHDRFAGRVRSDSDSRSGRGWKWGASFLQAFLQPGSVFRQLIDAPAEHRRA